MVDGGYPDSGYPFRLMQTLTYAVHKLVFLYNTKKVCSLTQTNFGFSLTERQSQNNKSNFELAQSTIFLIWIRALEQNKNNALKIDSIRSVYPDLCIV